MKRLLITVLTAALLLVSLLTPAAGAAIRYDYPENTTDPTDVITAPSAMMLYTGVRREQDVILFEKQADVRYQPGALMRVAMIGYAMKLIREGGIDMDTATGEYTLKLFNHYVAGTGLHVAMMNFGETWTVRDLLTLCAIQTAADAAVTLATTLSGSPEAFVEGLNAFAAELGCTNSHFTNVTCLNEDGQYMSARDVVTFTRYCMEIPELRSMLELTQYTVKPVARGSRRSWPSSNDMIRQSSAYYYQYAVGGKTGGTLTESSLVAYGSLDGYEYLAVVMGANRKTESGELTGDGYADARRLIRWGLIGFTYEMLVRRSEPAGTVPVTDCAELQVMPLVPAEDLSTVVAKTVDRTAITRRVTLLRESLQAPVEKGTPAGTLELYYQDQLIGTVELVTGANAPYSAGMALWNRIAAAFRSPWLWGGIGLVVLLCGGYVLLNVRYNRKRNKKWR